MFKIAKKLTVIMLSASIIFSCSGIIAHAEGIKDKKQEYYQEYKRIIREAKILSCFQLMKLMRMIC